MAAITPTTRDQTTPTPEPPDRRHGGSYTGQFQAAVVPAPAPVVITSQPAPPPSPIAAATPPPPPSPIPPSPSPINTLDRITQANAQARLISAYLGDPSAVSPPVWNDVPTYHRAMALRSGLHERLALQRKIQVKLNDPRWQIADDGVSLAARYQAAGEQGRMAIDFTWREGTMRVNNITLVPGT